MSEVIAGQFWAAGAPTSTANTDLPIQVDSQGRMLTSGGGTAGAPSGAVTTVQYPSDGVTLTRATVTMTGASGVLVAASSSRSIVIVSTTAGNAAAAIDITGGTAVLSGGGISLVSGSPPLVITGKAAQSAMTQIGTNNQTLTVYTG